MEITDKGRKKLASLMVIQEWSARRLSEQVGWKSHTILLRILRGEQRTIKPEKATAIAAHLGVGMDDLFVPRSSTVVRHNGARQGRRAA